MDLKNLFTGLFKRQEPNIQGEVPFVQLFGHEKTYGAPQPNDFGLMVKNYKSWAYACASRNGYSVAKCMLRLYKESISKEGDSELKEIKSHPFLDLIKSVNPFSNRFMLMSITQIFLELTGNAYWWMPRSNLRIPYMLWNIPSHWVKIVPDKERFIAGYVVQVPGKAQPIPFDEEEIVHFTFPSPFNMYYGTGPLLGAAYPIDLNTEIKTWGINFFKNNAQPSGVLYTDSTLGEHQYQRLKDSWNRKYKGTKNAGKIAILEQGLKYQQTGTTLKDAKFEDVSKEIRDEILAMFGVPASKLGLVEDVNRANAEANDYTYQKETILPRLTLIEEKINEKILPIYDERLICKFDNPVPEDKQFRLQEKQINIQSGFSSIDEERKKEGLEPFNLPETSSPLIPFSLTPAGQPKPQYEPMLPQDNSKANKKDIEYNKKSAKWNMFAIATAPLERSFTDIMRSYFQEQHSEVIRRLHQYKSMPVNKKGLLEDILFNFEEANEKLISRSKNSIRNSYLTGLTLGSSDTGVQIDFNLYEPNILRAVSARSIFFAERINKSTADLLANAINEGIQKGESIEGIAKRVDSIFRFTEDYRSKRIAQTEVIGATNSGQLDAYREAGFEGKEWITARDEKVRESHQIEGQKVLATESFTTRSGARLQYPGDRSSGAPASEIINCRCTVVGVRKME